MAIIKGGDPAELLTEDMHCDECGWSGKGAEAVITVNDYVRCPKCNEPALKGPPCPQPPSP